MDQIQILLKETPEIRSINLEFSEISDLEDLIPYLSQFYNLEELILFGNRIESLPIDMSSLSALNKLDVSNNLFTDVESILPGLKSLPNLKNLLITFIKDSDCQTLVGSLPGLLYLNDVAVERQEDYCIKQEDLENIAILYDDIRAVWRKTDSEYDKTLAFDFDEAIKSIMGDLSDVAKAHCEPSLLSVHMLKSKFRLYSICLAKTLQYIQSKTPEITEILNKTIHSLTDIQSVSFDMLLNAAQPRSQTNVAQNIEKIVENHQKEKKELLNAFNKEKEDLMTEIQALQDENKNYLDTLIKRTKSTADLSLQKPPQTSALIPKNELKDFITSIYSSKAKYDLKQSEGTPRQTMEQHMYLYLAQKYQSRSKSIQKATDIVGGLKKYCDDIDVLLFTKILRNECDENYRFLHDQVRETITEMVKQRSKTDEIKSNVWNDIIKFVYDEKDSESILNYIKTQKKATDSLNCADFINYILYFQLKSHEKYISKFNQLFKTVDTDSDGVISEEEFIELCKKFELEINMQEIYKFLQVLDPYGTQQILYSDCVAVFSTELVSGKSNPILQELT
jgi:Ca2+-binding EF-hand superfamily protein